MTWRALETAPEDEWVLLATTFDWTGEAIILRDDDNEPIWRWASEPSRPINPRLIPLGWQPLPAPITERVLP